MDSNEASLIGIGILIGMLITLILIGLCHIGDNTDIVNVQSLGEQMCAEHGLEYSHREIENTMPIIYCSDPTEEIEDGYLKKVYSNNQIKGK